MAGAATRILIVYGTIEGQTGKIANVISDELITLGHRTTLYDTNTTAKSNLNDYDGIIVGGSVHTGSYPTHLKEWIKLNSATLSNKPSAFYSVCLSILDTAHPESIERGRKIGIDLLKDSGWIPKYWDIFPGALTYTKYGWFKGRMMKWISMKSGNQDIDMSKDYEYTDWKQVRNFAQRFHAALLSNNPT